MTINFALGTEFAFVSPNYEGGKHISENICPEISGFIENMSSEEEMRISIPSIVDFFQIMEVGQKFELKQDSTDVAVLLTASLEESSRDDFVTRVKDKIGLRIISDYS